MRSTRTAAASRLVGRVAAVALSGVLVVACGDDDDDSSADDEPTSETTTAGTESDGQVQDGDGPTVDVDPGEVTVEQGDDSITSSAEFPDDFPDFKIRFPTDFSLFLVQERNVGGAVGWTVIGSVPKEPDLVEFELLGSYGDPDEHVTDDDAIRLRFDGANGLDLVFTLTADADGNTALTLSVTEV